MAVKMSKSLLFVLLIFTVNGCQNSGHFNWAGSSPIHISVLEARASDLVKREYEFIYGYSAVYTNTFLLARKSDPALAVFVGGDIHEQSACVVFNEDGNILHHYVDENKSGIDVPGEALP
jgi:hypothetical protein